MLPLSSLSIGQQALITAIEVDEALFHRLTALGFRVGKQLCIMRQGVFNGPLHIRLGTTDVILRNSEASQIKIKPL